MTVTLNPAYSWDCPECGRESFCRGLVPEMADEDFRALREDYGVEAWEEGCFMMMPQRVGCSHCGESFATTHYGV